MIEELKLLQVNFEDFDQDTINEICLELINKNIEYFTNPRHERNKTSENTKFYQTIGMNELYSDVYYPIKPKNIILIF